MENHFDKLEKISNDREQILNSLKEVKSYIGKGQLKEAFDNLNNLGDTAYQAGEKDLLDEIITLSEDVKNQMRSKEQNIEYNFETIKTLLKDRIVIEKIPHFKSVIERASHAFENGVATDNLEERKEFLASMTQAESYLGEKYRDDKDQRAYIVALNKGIEYLKNDQAA